MSPHPKKANVHRKTARATVKKSAAGQTTDKELLNETIVRTIPFPMNIVDRTGTILYTNDRFKNLFRKPPFGRKCFSVYRTDGKKCPDCPLKRPIVLGRTSIIETSGIMDGRTFRISHTGMMYQGKKALLEVFEDVTPRVWAETELARMTGDLFIINSIHGNMNRGCSLRKIMDDFNREACKTFACHGTALFLFDGQTDGLIMQNFLLPDAVRRSLPRGTAPDAPGDIRLTLDRSPSFRSFCRKNKPQIVEGSVKTRRVLAEMLGSLQLQKKNLTAALDRIQKKTPVSSIITVPLFSQDRLTGLMLMAGPGEFGQSDLHRLSTIAGDITQALERKGYEDSIRASEMKYKELTELLPQTVYETDETGMITFVNTTGLEIFGYTEKELDRGISVFQVVDPAEHAEVRKNMEAIIRENRSGFSEYTAVRKDGTPFAVLNYSVPVVRNGRQAGLRGIIIDISERKRMERTVRESEERYRNVVERANDGIVLLQEGKVVYVNSALTALSGYETGQLEGKSFFSFIHPDQQQVVAERYQRRLNGEAIPSIYESVLRHRDGHPIDVELNAGIIVFRGRPAHLVFVRDTTERKMTDRRLKDSLREKDLLLNEIHHRVKNNLQVITSLLSLQARYISDPDMQAVFNDSKSRVRSMALIHEKLYRSRDIAHIDFADYLQTLLSNLFRTYGATAERVGLELDVSGVFLDIDTAVPCGLIINELISNALKYAFGAAGKTDCVIRLAMRVRNGGAEYEMTVADNGPGMPDGLDFRNTESLGLQLVCTLVDQLEGTVRLTSDNGTLFTIRFPAPRRDSTG